MKIFLSLLLLSPLAYSQEYIFECVTIDKDAFEEEREKTVILLINTNEEFIIFKSNRYDDAWKKGDFFITADYYFYNQTVDIYFNTITGKVRYTLREKSGKFISDSNYQCKPTSRLIP